MLVNTASPKNAVICEIGAFFYALFLVIAMFWDERASIISRLIAVRRTEARVICIYTWYRCLKNRI